MCEVTAQLDVHLLMQLVFFVIVPRVFAINCMLNPFKVCAVDFLFCES